jgi:hypothetical protein
MSRITSDEGAMQVLTSTFEFRVLRVLNCEE